MELNKQKLQLWLDERVAAYNDGTRESIEMIRELCKQTGESMGPGGGSNYYYCVNGRWFADVFCESIPIRKVSWFFESTEEPETKIESVPDQWLQKVWAKKEALEKANPNMVVTLQVSECVDYAGCEIRFILNPKTENDESKQ